jgi:hypothetical protein
MSTFKSEVGRGTIFFIRLPVETSEFQECQLGLFGSPPPRPKLFDGLHGGELSR